MQYVCTYFTCAYTLHFTYIPTGLTTTSADVVWLTDLVLPVTQAVLVAQEDHLVHPYQVFLEEVKYLHTLIVHRYTYITYVRMYVLTYIIY